DSHMQKLFDMSHRIVISPGAALDIAGFSDAIYKLQGSGTIENSGAAATVKIQNGNFSGNFSGPITLDVGGLTILAGNAANVGTIDLEATARLDLQGASSANIYFTSTSSQTLTFAPSQFTGGIANLSGSLDRLQLPGIEGRGAQLSYSGDTSGGVLTLKSGSAIFHINMLGDYTNGSFDIVVQGRSRTEIAFFPASSSSAAKFATANSFDLSRVHAASHVADSDATHLSSSSALHEMTYAHSAVNVSPPNEIVIDHFLQYFFAHHAMPEALA
ncbi:MAG TPA: hypothetical protein VK759_04145, partial [Rhizomicrobium sp.]|nr:hypothetical protein [Rhizomicrobium sp.]